MRSFVFEDPGDYQLDNITKDATENFFDFFRRVKFKRENKVKFGGAPNGGKNHFTENTFHENLDEHFKLEDIIHEIRQEKVVLNSKVYQN